MSAKPTCLIVASASPQGEFNSSCVFSLMILIQGNINKDIYGLILPVFTTYTCEKVLDIVAKA